jgi:hypothetical protein
MSDELEEEEMVKESNSEHNESLALAIENYESRKAEYQIVKDKEDTKDFYRDEAEYEFGARKVFLGIKKILKTATGIQGIQDRKSAKNIKGACEDLYQSASELTEIRRAALNEKIISFGKYRLEALTNTVGRFLAFLEDMDQKNKTKEYEILDGIGLDTQTIEQMKSIEMSASKALASTAITGALGAAAAMGTPALVTGVVGAIGAASTGTAIAGLSGVAATNATLAWLGGGAIAAGGGGMAAGAAVLSAVTVGATAGVAILAAGLMASTHYSKKLTETKEFQKNTEIAVAEMEKAWAVMQGIGQQTDELANVTSELESRISVQLEYLEPLTIDFDTHDDYYNTIFQKSGLLIKSMGELAKTPLLDDAGNISPESAQIISKTHTILNKELLTHE